MAVEHQVITENPDSDIVANSERALVLTEHLGTCPYCFAIVAIKDAENHTAWHKNVIKDLV
jgi:hypothetical protein